MDDVKVSSMHQMIGNSRVGVVNYSNNFHLFIISLTRKHDLLKTKNPISSFSLYNAENYLEAFVTVSPYKNAQVSDIGFKQVREFDQTNLGLYLQKAIDFSKSLSKPINSITSKSKNNANLTRLLLSYRNTKTLLNKLLKDTYPRLENSMYGFIDSLEDKNIRL